MLSKEDLKKHWDSFLDLLNEQGWVQELKSKWEELDPQSKMNLKFASFGLGIFALLMIVATSLWGVQRLRKEVSEKRTLLRAIQSANDEVHSLKESAPNLDSEETDKSPWATYFESLTGPAGFDKASLAVSSEKPGTSGEQTKEALYDLNLKHLNIKQIVRYAFSLENGRRPVKIRHLLIDTKGDPTGYLDAALAVSAFSMVKHE